MPISDYIAKILSWHFISLFLTASVKFSVGVPVALRVYDFNFVEGLIFGTLSGCFGVVVWLYLSKYLFMAWDWIKLKATGEPKHIKRHIFSKRTRRIVKIKGKYGLIGLAFLTPAILSIPVGTIIAARMYRHNRRRVLWHLNVSVAIWSALFSGLSHFITQLLG